jgi:hypothetical protein
VYSPAAGVPHIYDVGLTLFLQHIIRSAKYPIHTHLIATLLSQVQLERDGEIITRSTVRECVDVLLRLAGPEREGGKSVYLTDFEPEFLRRSGEFYKLEAVEVLERGDSSQYLRNVSSPDRPQSVSCCQTRDLPDDLGRAPPSRRSGSYSSLPLDPYAHTTAGTPRRTTSHSSSPGYTVHARDRTSHHARL